MKVWVYQEYNDEYAYGEQITEIYDNPRTPIEKVKEFFVGEFSEYGETFEEVIEGLRADGRIDENDSVDVEEDRLHICVAYLTGKGYNFWNVYPLEILS